MSGRKIGQRKGVAHLLEAIIAAFVLLLFVLSITHLGGSDPDSQGAIAHKQTFNTLRSLDVNGTLRPAVEARDVSRIRSMVAQHTPNRNVEVALLALNATTADVTFTDQYTDQFPVPADTERERLRLWYRDAAAPNISINGQYIQNNTGLLNNTYTSLDISAETSAGSNTLRIDTDGTADIGYSIDIFNEQRSGAPPADQDVFTTAYLVSGVNTTFAPAEVTVFSWY